MHRLRIATWATLAGVALTLGCASSRNTCNCCGCCECCSNSRASFWQRFGGRRECCATPCPCGASGAPCATCSSCGGGAVGTLMGGEGPLLDDQGALGAVPGAALPAAPLTPAPVTTLPGGTVAPPLAQPTLPIAPTPSLNQPPLAQPVPSEPSSRRRLTSR